MAGFEEEEDLKPGMFLQLLVNSQNEVIKINKSKKIQLTNGIPVELTAQNLVDDLIIKGYVNGQESEEQVFKVSPVATIIEEDGTEIRIAPRDVQFQSAKLWQRMLTNFAGPMNNFILAVVLFFILILMQGGVQDIHSTKISSVSADSPAALAGLKAGDTIKKINNEQVTNWSELTETIQKNGANNLTVVYQRNQQSETVDITPKKKTVQGQTIYQIGVGVPMKTGIIDKFVGAFTMSINSFLQILVALGSLLRSFSLDKLGGPVAIYQISSQAANQGWTTIIGVMAMISMNLGIFNLLPIPALDGGKLVLNVIEGVRGKPLSQEKEGLITLIGFGFMMLLMILVTWNDIQRFFF